MTITPEDKDKLLNFFIDQNKEHFTFSPKRHAEIIGLDSWKLGLIFDDFERRNLIRSQPITYNDFNVRPKIGLFDLKHMGGFVGIETVMLGNIDKLNLEIQALQKQLGPDKLETVNKIAAIGGVLASYASLFKP